MVNKSELTQKEIEKAKSIMKYNDQELNVLPYKLALKYDSRTYCEYYFSLIRTKHNLFLSFYYDKDYNSRIIKIDLFIFSFIINYFINALFFDDDTMHKIYEDKGKFSFIYQLPQIIYSSLISSVLNTVLKLLALSENNILQYKSIKNDKDINKKETELINKLNIKFLLFFVISSILLLFFWYYLSMFSAIYTNTQIHLIKDILISFGFSLFYPFGIYLLPGLFRIPSLSNKKSKRSYLYSICKILQKI